MTEHKSLKRRVRERMRRTGESYTTAHRQLRSRTRAGALPGAVPGYPSHGIESHLPSGLVRHLLGAAGVDLTEPMVCGLGGGVGFLYAIFDYRAAGHPLLTLVAQHHPEPWIDAVASHLGIALSTVHSSSAAAALTKLDAALDAGSPAWLTVGRGLLPGHLDVSPVEAADPYPIVVAGRHDGEYLVEGVEPTAPRLSRDQLGTAWAAHRKGRFEMVTVPRPPEPAANGADDPVAAGIDRAVALTAAHLTGPVLGNSFDVNMGFSGMTKLAADLRDASTKRGWLRRFGTPEHARYALGRVSECLTHAYTAAGATRPLYAEFLTEAAGRTGSQALTEAAGLFARSGATWQAAADDAGRASLGEPAAECFESLADAVDRCRATEETAVDALRDHLRG